MRQASCALPDCDRRNYGTDRLCSTHRNRKRSGASDWATAPIRAQRPRGTGNITARGYVNEYAPGHPIAMSSGLVQQHRRVLYDAIGPGPHSCHWGCGRVVTWQDGLTVDHLDGTRTNNVIENLVPSCQPCNSARCRAGNPTTWASSVLVSTKES